MNIQFILAFLASGVAWYGHWAAGVARSYDNAEPVWWGLRGDKGRRLRETYGDEGAKAIMEKNCLVLYRIGLFATVLFLAAGVYELLMK